MVVDMNALMGRPGAKEELERITAQMEADPEASVLVDGMRSIEDAYEFVKRYAQVKFEMFKEIFHDVASYFKEDKVALKDEVLDGVVGGGFWSDLWNNKIVRYTVAAVVVGACAIAGAWVGSVAGTVVAGPAGMWVGGVAGFVAGVGAGIVAAEKLNIL